MLITYAYDPLSRRDTATRSSVNGAATDYAFDNASRLTTLAHDFSGGATNDQSYGFSYTAASQLQQRTASNDAYTWPISSIDRDYNRNGLNQYTTTTGTGATTFTHDARGNLISDGVRRFCYDLENRLLRVDDHADTSCSTPALTLSYDPLGRLHQSSDGSETRQFLYDGDALIAEYEGNDIVRRFVHGPGVDELVVQYDGSDLNTRIHLFADRQGSIIATNGATTNTYRYGPYGETDVWAGSRFRYTGQAVLDPNLGTSTPVALYHYKARVYDPVLGRFLQTDPVGYSDNLNLYAYVASDPLNNTDTSGACANLCTGLIGAAIGGGIEVVAQLAVHGEITNPGAIGREAAIGFVAGGTGIGGARLMQSAVRLTGIVRAGRVVGGVRQFTSGERIARAVGAGGTSAATADVLRRGTVDGDTAVAAGVGAAFGVGGEGIAQGGQRLVAGVVSAANAGQTRAAAARGVVGARVERAGAMTSHPGRVPTGARTGVVAGEGVNRAPDVLEALERQRQ